MLVLELSVFLIAYFEHFRCNIMYSVKINILILCTEKYKYCVFSLVYVYNNGMHNYYS